MPATADARPPAVPAWSDEDLRRGRLPEPRNPALVEQLVKKIRALADPRVAAGPQSTPDDRYDAAFAATLLVPHPEAARMVHALLYDCVMETLKDCGCLDEPEGTILNLTKQLIEEGFGSHVFEAGGWKSRSA